MRRKELAFLALGVALFGLATGLIVGAVMVPQRAAAAVPAPQGSTTEGTAPHPPANLVGGM